MRVKYVSNSTIDWLRFMIYNMDETNERIQNTEQIAYPILNPNKNPPVALTPFVEKCDSLSTK